jgi:stalled ribosome rescue protein Dom34
MVKEEEQGHLMAITMEDGIANIFLVSQHKTVHKAKIEKSIAKNNGPNSKAAASRTRFFDLIIDAVVKNFSGDNSNAFAKVNCVVIGSPGFVCENFCNYLKDVVLKNKTDFLKNF